MSTYSIDVVGKVKLGGLMQNIHIRGSRLENPVILMLHGGPGISNRDGIMTKHSDLCDDFTIVAWDQRGTCGSYRGTKRETLTVDQLVEDARQLTAYLCKRLEKEKIFIIGGSWGTQLGTNLAFSYPEQIAGYIGYGQVVNGVENENISYQFCVDKATQAGDKEALKKLSEIGPPVNGQYRPVFKGLMAQRSIMKKYGGHSVKGGSYWQDTVKPILLSKEYSLGDKYGMFRGYKLCLSAMWPTMVNYDFTKSCHDFKMPYYIFQGRHDNNTPSSLIQDFYDVINAPDKDLIWFEQSAHNPLGEEPDKFKSLIREKFGAIQGRN